jgi:hypothetical protein
MKGYLQRLSSRVLDPRGPIHPVVGSIFAPAPRVELDAGALIDRAAPPAGSAASLDRPAMAAPFPLRGATPEAAVSPRPRPSELPRPTPLVPPNDVRAVEAPAAPWPLASRPPIRAAEFADAPAGRTPGVGTAPSRIKPAPIGEIVLEADARRPPAPPRAPSGPSSGPEREPGALAIPAAPPRREPDEIEIHIGRIEVTAVLPAPPPPAVRPSRKALNLEAYLKRGRGGAS